MSVLKATTAQEIARTGRECNYMDGLFGGVKMPPTEVYLKSEADAVIAELKQKLDDYRYTIAVLRKENSHHKYKRCLDMAKLCENEYYKYKPIWVLDEYLRKSKRALRWYKTLLELAEKFKETK